MALKKKKLVAQMEAEAAGRKAPKSECTLNYQSYT